MANFIIKKPDGKLALWSTIADDFIFEEVTRSQLLVYWTAQYRAELEKRIDEAEAKGGEHMTWDQCLKSRRPSC